MLGKLKLLLGSALILLGILVSPAIPASAALVCDSITDECYIVVDSPGQDPVSVDSGTGFTPGASSCTYKDRVEGYVEIPCSTGNGNYWNNTRQCYVGLLKPQNAVPAGGAPEGGWYSCTQFFGPPRCSSPDDLGCDVQVGINFWSDTIPPGITMLTPRQAAERLVKTFRLTGIDIGFAPDPNIPGSKSYVGVPIWMWASNPQPLSWGPYTETATLGGVTITATAQVSSVRWSMGDGNAVTCGIGTAFQIGFGATDSPTCGYRYSQTSDTAAGGRFPITAASSWTVTWSGEGESGVIPLTSNSASSVEIKELQSVNVTPRG